MHNIYKKNHTSLVKNSFIAKHWKNYLHSLKEEKLWHDLISGGQNMDVFFDPAEHNKSLGLNVETMLIHARNKVYTFNTGDK